MCLPGRYNEPVKTVATVGAVVAGALVLLSHRGARELVGDVLIVVGSRLAPIALIPDVPGHVAMSDAQRARGEARLMAALRETYPADLAAPLPLAWVPRRTDD